MPRRFRLVAQLSGSSHTSTLTGQDAMALLRKGSSRISEENFNCRLQREKAKSGAVSASLAWNDPSDLDLHATVFPDTGGKFDICYRSKQAAGGYLDVDMHARDGDEVAEPVENIFWKKPPAGLYSIKVHLYKKRGARDAAIPFRALLKRDGEEDMSREGAVENDGEKRWVECFRFTVDAEGEITIGRVGTPLPTPAPLAAMKAMKFMKAMKSMKAMMPMKAMKKVMKVAMKKTSTIARGKKAKVEIWRGKKLKTTKGLKKDDLMKNKAGKIVSKKRSQTGKESKWSKATAKARAIKGYTGFKAIKKGGSFYEKAKEIMAEM